MQTLKIEKVIHSFLLELSRNIIKNKEQSHFLY